MRIAMLVLFALSVFWSAMLIAAAANTGYSHRRDYVSTLAAHGAEHPWLGIVAIAAAAAATAGAGLVVRSLSRTAAVALLLAGAGYLVAAFTRLECSNGAAGCGLGGRFAVSGATEISHWTATTVATVSLVAGIAASGVALLRRRRMLAGVSSLVAAAATAGAFLATGGDSPGRIQRAGILFGTGWLAAVAIARIGERRHLAAGQEVSASSTGREPAERRDAHVPGSR